MQNSRFRLLNTRLGRSYTIWLGSWLAVSGCVLITGSLLVWWGSSFHHLVTGLGLLLSGVLIARGQPYGAVIYAVTHLFTFVWAIWDVGYEQWPVLPRVYVPIGLLSLVLLSVPLLRLRERGRDRDKPSNFTLAVLGITGVALALVPLAHRPPVAADQQDLLAFAGAPLAHAR